MKHLTIFYVYIHRFKNGMLYVGKGCGRRAWQISKGRHNTVWDRVSSKYGNPKVRIVAKNLSESDSLKLEMILIAKLRAKSKRLCNQTDGGNGCLGLLVSDETRRKLSAANSGINCHSRGRKHSDEAKDKISKANKGRFIGGKSALYDSTIFDFINDRSGNTFKGTQWELSKKENRSQSGFSMLCSGQIASFHGWRLSSTPPELAGHSKGSAHGRFDHTEYSFKHDSGIVEYCTRYALSQKYNLTSPANMSSLCKGKIPSYKGWRIS